MKTFTGLVGLIARSVAITWLIVALAALPTLLLWNSLMPVIFGLPSITYIQALGLLFLSALFFFAGSVILKGLPQE